MKLQRNPWVLVVGLLLAGAIVWFGCGCAATSYDIEEFSPTTGKPLKRAHAAYYGQDKAVQGLSFKMGTTELKLDASETKDVGTRETAALLREFNQDVLGPLVRAAAKKAGLDVGESPATPTPPANVPLSATKLKALADLDACPVFSRLPQLKAVFVGQIKDPATTDAQTTDLIAWLQGLK